MKNLGTKGKWGSGPPSPQRARARMGCLQLRDTRNGSESKLPPSGLRIETTAPC